MLGFDDYADISARLDASSRGSPARRTRRATGARCCRSPRSTGPARGRARARRCRAPDLPRPAPAPARAGSPARAGRRPAQDRLRLRPALRVLRDPVLPRRVRVAPPGRRARRGALAGRRRASASWSWSARTPRPTARTSATCALLETLLPRAGRRRRHRPGAGLLPAAGRDAARR